MNASRGSCPKCNAPPTLIKERVTGNEREGFFGTGDRKCTACGWWTKDEPVPPERKLKARLDAIARSAGVPSGELEFTVPDDYDRYRELVGLLQPWALRADTTPLDTLRRILDELATVPRAKPTGTDAHCHDTWHPDRRFRPGDVCNCGMVYRPAWMQPAVQSTQ